MVWLLIALVVSIATGFFVAELLLPRGLKGVVRALASLSLGIGLGSGISSICMFMNLLLLGSQLSLILLDLTVLTLVVLLFVRERKRGSSFNLLTKIVQPQASKLQKIIPASFACALVLAVLSFVSLVIRLPHGRWDAWVLWNTKARFLFAGGDQWRALFTQLFQDLTRHPDYPLFLPLNVARSWIYFEDRTVLAPILIASLMAAGLFGLLYFSLAVLRSRSQALIAVIVLLGTPYFIRQSAALETDVPLAFFFLATTVLLLLHEKLQPERNGMLILAGLTAGLAAWTKNEGLLFLIVVVIAQLIVRWRVSGWRDSLSRLGSFALGAGPVISVVIFFKLKLALSTVHLASQTPNLILATVTDLSRYKQIFNAVTIDLYGWGDWYIHPILLVVLYPICLGIRSLKDDFPTLAMILLILGLMAFGYFVTLLITPYDLAWHLHTTVKRLILHLWPIAIILYFLIVQTPDESLGTEEIKSTASIAKGSPNYV